VVLSAIQGDGHGGTNVFGGADLRPFGATAAITLFPADPGGVIRRLPYEVFGVRSFAIAAAERYLGKPIARSSLGGKSAWIDLAGPEGTVPTVSYSDVLRGSVKPSFFRGKIVVVGQTDVALHDVHATATSPTMSGPEIQANAIATALAGFPLKSV